jgi:hypothetical protein
VEHELSLWKPGEVDHPHCALVARRDAGWVLTFDRRLQGLCERAAISSRLLG